MEEFNIEEFARMFDAALASDNPSVKKALRNFMMIAAIVHAENSEEQVQGPLETLVKKVSDLERMVRELQNNRTAYPGTTRDYYKDYYTNYPTWVYSPTTSVSTTGSISSTSSMSKEYYADEIFDILKDLKFNDN